jgi:hypothetical protein
MYNKDLVDGMKKMISAEFMETDMHGTPQEIAREHGFNNVVMTSQLDGADLEFLGKVIDLAGDLGDRHLQDRLSTMYGIQSVSAECVTLSVSDNRRDEEDEEDGSEHIFCEDEGETDSRADEDLSFSAEASLGISSQFDVQITMNGLGADGAIGSSI